MSRIWITKQGKRIHVENMEESHLLNAYRLSQKKLEDYPYTIVGCSPDDFDVSENTELQYRVDMLEEELLRRKLIE